MMKKAQQAVPNQQLRLTHKERGRTWLTASESPLALNVMRWEREMTKPSAHYVQRLCQFFDKSAAELGLSSRRENKA